MELFVKEKILMILSRRLAAKSKETKISEICKMTGLKGIYTERFTRETVKNIYKILNDNLLIIHQIFTNDN